MNESAGLRNVRIEMFGGLRILVDSQEVPGGPSRQQVLLARLVAARGRSVSLPNLIDTLWADSPPSSAANQVHRYVGDLRRLFQPDLQPRQVGQLLLPTTNGYRLPVNELSIDLDEIHSDWELARAASSAGEMPRAVAIYERLLRSVANRPLSNLPADIVDLPEFAAIGQDRISVAVDAARAAIEDRPSAAFLHSLEAIALTAPLNESLQAATIRLVASSGRRAHALEIYEQTRRLLVEELGIDAGADLAAAHLFAMTEDAPVARAAVEDSTVVTRTLPATIAGFVFPTQMEAQFATVSRKAAASSGGIAVVTGMAGVGKTTAAVHWAHTLEPAYPDGTLYLNFQGFDPEGRSLTPAAAVDRLLEALGEDLSDLEPGSPRLKRYGELLENRRMILVLDNVHDVDQIRPLLPKTSLCFTVVTSRNQLANLVVRDGATPVPLGAWNAIDSERLLAARIGDERITQDPESASAIVEECAGLPLALAIVGARLAIQPDLSLSDVAGQLRQPALRLDELGLPDSHDQVRSALTWSARSLSEPAARLLRLLAIHRGKDFTLNTAASLTGIAAAGLRALLEELVTSSMLDIADGDRWNMHDLVRLFASEQLLGDERHYAEQQLIQHYVRTMRNAYEVTGRSTIVKLPRLPKGRLSPEAFNSQSESADWYLLERQTVREVLAMADRNGQYTEYCSIVFDWRGVSSLTEVNADAMPYSLRAAEIAETLGDPMLIAEASRDLGWRYGIAGDMDSSAAHFARALELFQREGDALSEAKAYWSMSRLAHVAHMLDEHLDYAEKAVDAARRSGDNEMLADAIVVLLAAYNTFEKWDETIRLAEEGVPLAVQFAPSLESEMVVNVAQAFNAIGRHREAFDLMRIALETETNMDRLSFLYELVVAAAPLGERDALHQASDEFEQHVREMTDYSLEFFGSELDDMLAVVRAAASELDRSVLDVPIPDRPAGLR